MTSVVKIRNIFRAIVFCFVLSFNLSAVSAEDLRDTSGFATSNDIRIFDHYIGRFHSEQKYNQQLEKEVYFAVEYSWFDDANSIAWTMVSYIDAESNQETLIAEAYYFFDPIREQLRTVQFFKSGLAATGYVDQFEHSTGARKNWARFKTADGNITEIRDEFEKIDQNSWKNKALMRCDGSQWTEISNDTFSRVN